MGQKVNPVSYRLQISKDWSSKWFTKKTDFKKWLIEDIKIREVIEERFKARPTIAKINIERTDNLTTITILTAKAGAVIGKQGAGINELRKELEKFVSQPVRLNVEEVKKPELSAKLVAENIGFQLGKRMNFRRAVKMACQSTMAAGAKGVRIEVGGRLNGAEMSRREKFIEGSVPLHTLRADIDFYCHHAPTIAGIVGVYRREIIMAILLPKKTSHRKVRKGKNEGVATRCNYVAFGDYGLMSLDNERINSKQIEAARQAITRYIKRGGKIWIRIFPHTPVTKKPLDVKMGSGKGEPQFFVAKVKAGTVMFELADVTDEQATEALRLASHKLPVRCKIIKREEF